MGAFFAPPTPASHLPWRHMRYAPAYRKHPLLRALGFANSAWHTRLEAVFTLYFHHLVINFKSMYF
jgi:hypothetical protein